MSVPRESDGIFVDSCYPIRRFCTTNTQVSHRVVVPMNMIDVSRIHGQTFSIFYSHASRTRKISGGWGAQLTRNGEIAGMDSNVNY